MKIRSVVTSLLVAISLVASASASTAHWGYGGAHGPNEWGDMKAEFAQCKLGKLQSPIDIRDAKKSSLPALDFHYTKSAAEVVNNGHTIQTSPANGGWLNLDGVQYKLVQFHFHTPSEERIKGKSYAMDIHLVHQNAEGKLAVVAVLLKEGKTNTALGPLLENLPQAEGDKKSLSSELNPVDLLPAERGYYKFMGSLTTPPCSEGVQWLVLKEPVEVSKAQIAAFHKLYKANARPVQPLDGRQVEESP